MTTAMPQPALAGGGDVAAPAASTQPAANPAIAATPQLASAIQGLAVAVEQLAAAVQALQGAMATTTAAGPTPTAPTPPTGTAPNAPETPPTGAQPPPPPGISGGGSAATSQAKAGVLLIGDSLTVGVRPHMPKTIDGAPVTVDATGGIPLAEGMRRYDAVKEKPRVVELALFTNNSPKQVDELHKAIQKTIDDARQRGGRVVWATIVRPGNYDAANAMIRDMAAKNADVMGVVDWAAMVAKTPSLVGGDGVHSSPDGYKVRAKAFVDAARA